MIIVVACDVPLVENNGTAVAACNLIRYLRSRGHTVRTLCPGAGSAENPDSFLTEPINFGPLNGYVRKNGVEISASCRETVCAALDGADALHTITPFFLCHAAAEEAKKRGIAITSGFHCQAENFSSHVFLMNAGGFNRCLYRWFDRSLYQYADKIHYPTQFIRNVFEESIGHTTDGEVISNGVGAEFAPAREEKPPQLQDKFVILFTGRYSKEKSHWVLIDAVAQSKYRDRIQLIFAGDGPLREKLETDCRNQLPIQPIFGFHPREELIHMIHYADLYVHPAEIEIEAIACLEAIRGGLVPVISQSPRSATPAFALDDKNLFRVNDPADLRRKMEYWLDHPEERQERSRAYAGFTEQFDRTHCMERMEQMICAAVARHTAEEDCS